MFDEIARAGDQESRSRSGNRFPTSPRPILEMLEISLIGLEVEMVSGTLKRFPSLRVSEGAVPETLAQVDMLVRAMKYELLFGVNLEVKRCHY